MPSDNGFCLLVLSTSCASLPHVETMFSHKHIQQFLRTCAHWHALFSIKTFTSTPHNLKYTTVSCYSWRPLLTAPVQSRGCYTSRPNLAAACSHHCSFAWHHAYSSGLVHTSSRIGQTRCSWGDIPLSCANWPINLITSWHLHKKSIQAYAVSSSESPVRNRSQ